ncbi:hypothetical protein HNQ71_007034 [Mesorhizobium sangaii]|uniref:Uncharacterized protein n=1 Tax=Mesorhizobium sangaii TaxID=505389 RepID=A0A841PGA6_9HYPH|nr:hypothetical protein [Mesorhizobium sangaii]
MAEMRKVIERVTVTSAVLIPEAPYMAETPKSHSQFLSASGHPFLLSIDRPTATPPGNDQSFPSDRMAEDCEALVDAFGASAER